MRITKQQQILIKQVVNDLITGNPKITLFGSRVDDSLKGGDIDLMITLKDKTNHPAELSAKIAAKLTRLFQGRKVDILLSAPNLQEQSIHGSVREKGIVL
jgi:predicted nucleotidyltransferase